MKTKTYTLFSAVIKQKSVIGSKRKEVKTDSASFCKLIFACVVTLANTLFLVVDQRH